MSTPQFNASKMPIINSYFNRRGNRMPSFYRGLPHMRQRLYKHQLPLYTGLQIPNDQRNPYFDNTRETKYGMNVVIRKKMKPWTPSALYAPDNKKYHMY